MYMPVTALYSLHPAGMWLRVTCINALLSSALFHPAPWATAAAAAASHGHFSLFPWAPSSKWNIRRPWEKVLPLPLDFHFATQQLTGLSSSAFLRIALPANTKPRSSFHVYLWGFWPVSEENRLTSSPVAVLPGPGSRGCCLGHRRSGVTFRPGLHWICGEECEARRDTGTPDWLCGVWLHLTAGTVFAQMDTCGNQARIIFPNFLLPAWVWPEKQCAKYTVVHICFFSVPLFHGQFAVSWGWILSPHTCLLVTFLWDWVLAFQS